MDRRSRDLGRLILAPSVLGVVALLLFVNGTASPGTTSAVKGPRWHQALLFGSSPAGRDRGGMAFDPMTNTTILFGGYNPLTPTVIYGDTWSLAMKNYSGKWTQVSPKSSPFGRANFGMIYDPALKGIVLFGGLTGQNGYELNDTWLWGGSNWTQLAPKASPSPRENFAMAYDTADGAVVLFGGLSGGVLLGDTWEFNGTTWSKQSSTANPPAREFAAMAYDATSGRTILTQGFNSASTGITDTWAFRAGSWTRLTGAHTPAGRAQPMLAPLANGTLVLFGGETSAIGGFTNATYLFYGGSWHRLFHKHLPSVRKSGGFSLDQLHGELIEFGGNNGPSFLASTWVLH